MNDDDKPNSRPRRERLPPKTSAGTKKPLKRIRSASADEGSDDVGYGKPPQAHQFKSGESGNPKGRPKGSKNEFHYSKRVAERENLASTAKWALKKNTGLGRYPSQAGRVCAEG